jgi:hypothetical protein
MVAPLVTCFTPYRRSVRLCLGISIRGISPNWRCHFRRTRWSRNSKPSVRSEIRVFSSTSCALCSHLVLASVTTAYRLSACLRPPVPDFPVTRLRALRSLT